MTQLKLTFLLLVAIPFISQHVCAQWIGSDEQPIESAKAQASYLGSDVTKSTTPGGPSAIMRVYGEGYPTPPVYTPKPEHISALKLNPGQESALKKAFPDFVPWTLKDYGSNVKYFPFSKRQMPYAINWDFNEKITPITVIAGHDGTKNYLTIFKPQGTGYRVIRREAGFIQPLANYSHRTLPVLRMIKGGTFVRIYSEDAPSTYPLRHDAFTYFEVEVSSNLPADRQPQLSGDNRIYYFHEGLFQVNRADIKGLRANTANAADKKGAEDAASSPEIMKALAGFNKDFKIWTSRDYPQNTASFRYAIRQDFNGDGIQDMVVAGHDNDANLVMEVISGTDGYHVSPLGDSNPCYAKARGRNTTLKLKPSHSLSLYKKGANYTGLAPKATKNLWNYSDTSLVGIRMLNTCIKHPTGPADDLESDFEYGDWGPWTDKNKETLYVYGEADDVIYCPSGIDHCGFELLPSEKDNGNNEK